MSTILTNAVTAVTNNSSLTLSPNGTGNVVLLTINDGAITLAPNGTGIVDVQGSMNSSISSTGKSLVFGF